MATGFRIFTKRHLPPRNVVEAFSKIPAACVADCMGRLCSLSSDIKLLSAPGTSPMCGVALTVKTSSVDNLMIHKALDMCQEGDVLVISSGGDRNRSLLGEHMTNLAKHKKAAGLIIDGPIRDLAAIARSNWPLYATGSIPDGPYRNGPGEVNVPISCGNAQINPGDILLGDRDGVIVIPRQDAEDILKAAWNYFEVDNGKLPLSQKGLLDRSWVDKALADKNCQIIEETYDDYAYRKNQSKEVVKE